MTKFSLWHISAPKQHFFKVCVAPIIATESLSVGTRIGPSGVRALPLAAGINVGGQPYYLALFFFLSEFLSFLPEWVVVGFQIFAWAPN